MSRQHTISFAVGSRIILFFGLLMASVVLLSGLVRAEPSNQHLLTIYDGSSMRSIISSEDTLRKVFAEADIPIAENDIVEPSLDAELVAKDYKVNIYRARPVTIVDGSHKVRVMTAHQSPKQIAEHAGVTLQDEDITTLSLSSDVVSDGASLRLVIDRATPVRLELFGKKETVYTQATTVEEFLKEKSIDIGEKDHVVPNEATPITKNMRVQVWREGKQTVTRQEKIAFPVRQIEDSNRKVGYREVETPGVAGRKLVTYQIEMRNGKEVSRKAIETVVTKQPKAQVERVGTKPSFGGDFAAALAKLRSCEGGYTSWNPAGPYYGAYQFDRGTWGSVADPGKYGSATPAEQDAAARALYERRGWSPWPHCGAGLPDIYR